MKKKRMMCTLATGCIMIQGSAMHANALEMKADTAETNHALKQVVVTGTGTHSQQGESAVPVRVLTAEEIGRAHITSVQEALVMLTPSVTMMTNGMGQNMSMNGLGEDYILILVDGHRVTGDDRYTRINMANVKRIELLNGAASALYGSEAIGGVINIITHGPSRERETDAQNVSVTSDSHFTSHGRFTESIAGQVEVGRLTSTTGYQMKQASNWQVNPHELVMGKLMPTGRVMSQAFSSNQVDQRLAWNFDHGVQAYVRGGFYQYQTDRPQTATYYKGSTKKDPITGQVDTLYTENPAYAYNLVHKDWTYGGGVNWKVKPRIYLEADFYSDNLDSQRDTFNTVAPAGRQLTKRTHYYNGTLKGIFHIGHWNKLSAGAEYIHETYRSYNFAFRKMYTMSVYAQDEMRIAEHLQAVMGARLVNNEMSGAYATPSAQLMYSPGPVRIRAGYSAGYRTPTLLQMYYENEDRSAVTIGNTDLKPEKSNFWNVNVDYNNRWMSLTASAYYNSLRDMINYRVLTDAEAAASGLAARYPQIAKFQQRDNIDKARVRGLQLSATFYLPINLRFGGSYALNDTEAETTALNKTTQLYELHTEPIDRSVKHSGTAFMAWGTTYRRYTLDVRANAHIQGERWSSSYGYAPSFNQIDLNTSHTWNLESTNFTIGVGVQNLLNSRDTRPWNSNFSTLHPGRCLYASVKFVIKNTRKTFLDKDDMENPFLLEEEDEFMDGIPEGVHVE